MKVAEVQIVPIKPADGLIAFASCVINDQLYIGSIGVHKRLDGLGYRLTYPTKMVGSRKVNFFHPVTKEAGTAIEMVVSEACNELFERSSENHGRYRKAVNSHSEPTDI